MISGMLSKIFDANNKPETVFTHKAAHAEVSACWEAMLPAVVTAAAADGKLPNDKAFVAKLDSLAALEVPARAFVTPSIGIPEMPVSNFLDHLALQAAQLSPVGRAAIEHLKIDEVQAGVDDFGIKDVRKLSHYTPKELSEYFELSAAQQLILRYSLFEGGGMFFRSGLEVPKAALTKLLLLSSNLITGSAYLGLEEKGTVADRCDRYLTRSSIHELTRLAQRFPFPSQLALLSSPALLRTLADRQLFRVSNLVRQTPRGLNGLASSAFNSKERADATFNALDFYCRIVADAFNHTPQSLRDLAS